MSKRKRRRRQRTGAPSVAGVATPSSRSVPHSQRDAIPTDYTHIIRDLKRIALFGGLLVAGLVALSFVL
ncbi:MAG: hypothetical protein ACE5FI_00630 [Anaerolineales bacterium]